MIWPLQSQCDAFYGDPRGPGDEVNPAWESANLVEVTCPWTLNTGGTIRIHRKCAESLARVLSATWEACGRSQVRVQELRYHIFDGSFNYRAKRGGTTLSMHAYAVALDWDAKDNEQHSMSHLFTHDSPLVQEFIREGWIWGGDWSPGSIDAMHFQAARVHGDAVIVVGGGDTVSKPDDPNALIDLRFGSSGELVGVLQQRLFVDNIFGHVTEDAVKAFQKEHGLKVDGIVGFDTWKVLFKTPPVPVPHTIPGPTPQPLSTQMRLVGKASWFGGPADTGVEPSEGLAFIDEVSDQPSIFLSEQPPHTTGLARRLDPTKSYIACRWDYNKFPKQSLLKHKAKVKSVKTGLEFTAWPADWGPGEQTGRVADLSPTLLSSLGIDTDDTVEVIYPYNAPAEPAPVDEVVRMSTSADPSMQFDLWGVLKAIGMALMNLLKAPPPSPPPPK